MNARQRRRHQREVDALMARIFVAESAVAEVRSLQAAAIADLDATRVALDDITCAFQKLQDARDKTLDILHHTRLELADQATRAALLEQRNAELELMEMDTSKLRRRLHERTEELAQVRRELRDLQSAARRAANGGFA